MSDHRRIDIGFQGGQVLSVRAAAESHEALEKALETGSSERWISLETDDSTILVDLAQVVYLRREAGDQKVGF